MAWLLCKVASHVSYLTTVAIDLTEMPGGEGTAVRLIETGYPDTPGGLAALLNCAAGWGEALTLLKFWLEHGVRY